MVSINKSDVFCIIVVVAACTQSLVLSHTDDDDLSSIDENYLLTVPSEETPLVYKEMSYEN